MLTLPKELEESKAFLYAIVDKVKFNEFKFSFDSICFPTYEQINDLKAGKNTHMIRMSIAHYGKDNDSDSDEKRWLTHFGFAHISDWTEDEIVRAIYVCVMQKLRHEASETFKYNGHTVFNEHYKDPQIIP